MGAACILARIDAWHEADTAMPLHAWLGWTAAEYATWVERSEEPRRWGAPTVQCGSVGPGDNRDVRWACARERWHRRVAAETARHADATARVDALRETAESLAAEREEPQG